MATEWEIKSKEADKRFNDNKRKYLKSKTKREGDQNEQTKAEKSRMIKKIVASKKNGEMRIFRCNLLQYNGCDCVREI